MPLGLARTSEEGSEIRMCIRHCFALLAGACLFAACAFRGPAPTAPPALLVGTSGDYAPFSMRDNEGRWSGFDVAVAERLAADLGKRLVLVPFQWPNLVGDLERGSFDVAMSGVTIRADRALRLSFTRPYTRGGAVLVVRRQESSRFSSATNANREGVRIAVNQGGHLERVARQHLAKATMQTVSDNLRLPELLLSRTVDAVVSDSLEAATWDQQEFVALPQLTQDHKSYALRRDAGPLASEIDVWIAAREVDGWLNQQRQRYLGANSLWSPEQASLETLAAAIDLRLKLMPYVAAVKHRDGLPIADPIQEQRVLERVATQAATYGLQADGVVDVFRLLITAAKAVESKHSDSELAGTLDLADLRHSIAGASSHILAALQELTHLSPDQRTQPLEPFLRQQLEDHALDEDLVAQIATAIGRVRVCDKFLGRYTSTIHALTRAATRSWRRHSSRGREAVDLG